MRSDVRDPLLDNIILLSDSYKNSHNDQYPPKTTKIYSYFESRGGLFDCTLFFGLQYYLERYFTGKVVTQEVIDIAEEIINEHFQDHAFDRNKWEYILKEHDGHLPIEICALPEGSVVPTGNALITVENTDPNCRWVTNYIETALSNVWYPTTVATLSREYYNELACWVEETGAEPSWLQWMLHEMGARGVSCPEQAAIGALAHLCHGFRGSDTMRALGFGRKYYDCNCAAYSIPAYEHSTVTSWGKEREAECYRNAMKIYPKGAVSVVSDSWDVFNACENIWGGTLKVEVLQRPGRIVIRLDSGNAAREGDKPGNVRKCLDILGNNFPTTTNKRGYRVLHPNVRILQSDGIDIGTIVRIFNEITYDDPSFGRWSADNVLFGSGGGLLQKVNRDTQKFAFKCAEATVNGEAVPVFKSPVTQPDKKSKRGRQRVICDVNQQWKTVPFSDEKFFGFANRLEKVFLDGKMVKRQSFEMIRGRSSEKGR